MRRDLIEYGLVMTSFIIGLSFNRVPILVTAAAGACFGFLVAVRNAIGYADAPAD
jgi:hypothetical protein